MSNEEQKKLVKECLDQQRKERNEKYRIQKKIFDSISNSKNTIFLGGTELSLQGQNYLLEKVQSLKTPLVPWPQAPTQKMESGPIAPDLQASWDVIKNEADLIIFWGGEALKTHREWVENVLAPKELLPNRNFIFLDESGNQDTETSIQLELIDRLGFEKQNISYDILDSLEARQLELLVRLKRELFSEHDSSLQPSHSAINLIKQKISSAKRVQVFIEPQKSQIVEQWRLIAAHQWQERDYGISCLPTTLNSRGLEESMLAKFGFCGAVEFTPEGRAIPLDPSFKIKDLNPDLLVLIGIQNLNSYEELQEILKQTPHIVIGPEPSPSAGINFKIPSIVKDPFKWALIMRQDGRVLHVNNYDEHPLIEYHSKQPNGGMGSILENILVKDPLEKINQMNSRKAPFIKPFPIHYDIDLMIQSLDRDLVELSKQVDKQTKDQIDRKRKPE